MTSTSEAVEEIVANSAPGEANDYNAKIIEEFRANEGRVGGPWAGTTMILIHHIGAKSGIERVSAAGLLPSGRGPLRDRRLQWRIANPPRLVLQPQGQPQDQSRGRAPDVHGTGRGTGRHRPRRAVAEAGRAVPFHRRIPGQDHAADSGGHADPPGLTCDKSRRLAPLGSGGEPVRARGSPHQGAPGAHRPAQRSGHAGQLPRIERPLHRSPRSSAESAEQIVVLVPERAGQVAAEGAQVLGDERGLLLPCFGVDGEQEIEVVLINV